MREIAREMLSDLPEALATAVAVSCFIAGIAVWSGWFAGVLQ